MGMVKHVPMQAGDVLFFLASAQTHGAFAWQGEMPRRGILMSYRSRNIFPD
jgi:ectoine hydroxylase-related dioxygenase (phytanoyl-CoA dioxygenase family)